MHVETMNSERGMNPVTMTIINPRKEYWPSRGSNQVPLVLESCTLPTEPFGVSKLFKRLSIIWNFKSTFCAVSVCLTAMLIMHAKPQFSRNNSTDAFNICSMNKIYQIPINYNAHEISHNPVQDTKF